MPKTDKPFSYHVVMRCQDCGYVEPFEGHYEPFDNVGWPRITWSHVCKKPGRLTEFMGGT